ncbi:MAG: chromate efflux transporter [Alphaproteobacteria bacterium]
MERTPAFGEALRLWLKVGVLSFGGPAAQIALLHRLLVEEKRWIGERRFLQALNFCMLLPGPEAQQLATYAGWLLHGIRGGLAAGILFVLPGAALMLGISLIYATYGDVSIVQALFYGIQAAVIAIVVEALLRIARRALKNGEAYVIAALAFVGIFFLALPFPLIVLAAALWGFVRASAGRIRDNDTSDADDGLIDRLMAKNVLTHARPSATYQIAVGTVCLILWLAPVAALTAAKAGVFADIARFFSLMAVVTFGGAYAVLAYVAQEAVQGFHWLTPADMLRGLGLAETTPGPLILVTQFVGFLAAFREAHGLNPYLAGTLGALLATWVTFAPSFLWIFAGAPYMERLRAHARLQQALSAVTAAVTGVILNLAVWFALHVWFGNVSDKRLGVLYLHLPDLGTIDLKALALTALATISLFYVRAGIMATIGGAAILGLAFSFL